MTATYDVYKSAHRFDGWSYDFADPFYPAAVPGVSIRVAAEPSQHKTNCCCFVEAVLVDIFDVPWGKQPHADMMILDGARPFSPVEACVAAGIGKRVHIGDDHALNGVYVAQGWRRLSGPGRTVGRGDGGHTFMIIHHDGATDKVLTLEANASWGIGGVGWRGIGPTTTSPANYAQNPEVWTWARLRKYYPEIEMARIDVR